MINNMYLLTNLISFLPVIIIFAIMPYIVRKNILFGVNAPRDFYATNTAKSMRRNYTLLVIIVGILFLGISCILPTLVSENYQLMVMMVSLFAYIGIIMIAYVSMWRKAKGLKEELEWQKQTQPVAVVDTSFYTSKIAVSTKWFIAYILIIITTIALGFLFYDKMPQNVPMNTTLDGVVTNSAQKSYQLLFYLPAVQLFITIVFAFIHFSVKRARPELNSQDVEKTVQQNIKFRYAWSCFVVFGGMALILVFLVAQLQMLTLVPSNIGIIITLSSVGLLVLTAILLAVRTGQSGSRIQMKSDGITKTIDRADDKHWKAGMIYVNKDDPSLFVEKRFGVGFTVNFGRPAGWILLAVIVIIVIGAIIIGK
ncbi:MAG: DUF1648 domain-containing protein [Clostridiales bacterium]|nr:DUF1648 domain-containing protein [Clostridiales bacterium]